MSDGGGRYMSGDNQLAHSLIQSLKELRKKIFMWTNQWDNIDPILYLRPFLNVIRCDETGAPITGVALSSLYKILTLDVFDLNTVNVKDAMHLIVDTVTSCCFEVTDPASEEVVLMKILQVLVACMKSKASTVLSNQHVCTIVDTCFRVVHQAGTKSELLQRIARNTMHELVRCIFSRLPEVEIMDHVLADIGNLVEQENGRLDNRYNYTDRKFNNGNIHAEDEGGLSYPSSSVPSTLVDTATDGHADGVGNEEENDSYDLRLMKQPYGVPCMFEIFQFLCSLLDVAEHGGMDPKSNALAFDEDVPLFALGLINSAIELGGSSFSKHPRLLNLIQDDLFYNLMRFGFSMSPLILSMVCSIVFNLYHRLRTELKLQLEAFFSSVILRLAQSRYGASYQQQEVAMEALVDYCRQTTFMVEMYANFDSEITSSDVFEELVNLLSKSAFPVNSPLTAMNTLALDGLIAVIQGMAERIRDAPALESAPNNLEDYTPFWVIQCNDYGDPGSWVPFVRQMKYIKRKLMIGADYFNQAPKKGFKHLQGLHLLPEELDPHIVACFFRHTAGLDKNLVGDFLGNHDQFCVEVLHEFARTFDFKDMSLDTALRIFLETFKLPGESQKIQRVLEAFSESYYLQQSLQILVNKDAALLLSYSLIMLNTDQHNVQVKKKMTQEDFIRNNRRINGGSDLPREYLSQLYHSICRNEIRTTSEQGAGFPDMTPSLWVYLMHKSKKTAPYIIADNRPYLDHDMFAIVAGPTIAAISVVFDHAEDEDVHHTCIDGFFAVAEVAASYHLQDVLDDLVISLYDATDSGHEKPVAKSSSSAHLPSMGMSRRPSGLMGRVSQLLSFDTEETRSEPTDEELAAHQLIVETIQQCHINNIFTESKFLQADSLLQLAQAIMAAGCTSRETDSPGDDGTAVFCLELLITITLNNRDRISLLWKGVYEHIANIVQSTVVPCALVEKAVSGILSICHRLLPYKENLVDELLRSLQLVLKLDARVADAYCEHITQEVGCLVKANASRIRSQKGWRTVLSLLAITARHPEASEVGFDALSFIMSKEAHLLPSNFVLCVDAARQFAESWVGEVDRSVHAVNLMVGSVDCLVCWAHETKVAIMDEDAAKMLQDIGEMWLRLVQGLKIICLDNREVVRNHAIVSLQKCLVVAHDIDLPHDLWLQCFDLVIFTMLDDLIGIAQDHSQKNYRNMEGTLMLAMKLLPKVFLLSIDELMQSTSFSKLWLGVLGKMQKYMKVKIRGKRSEKLQELLPELLKNMLLTMKAAGVLVQGSASGGDGLWALTWSHVSNIAPSLQAEVFPGTGPDDLQYNQAEERAVHVAAIAALTPMEAVVSKG
ncbi:hypothetical protein Ancab_000418 [Ancistrocladus abbreviatus]